MEKGWSDMSKQTSLTNSNVYRAMLGGPVVDFGYYRDPLSACMEVVSGNLYYLVCRWWAKVKF